MEEGRSTAAAEEGGGHTLEEGLAVGPEGEGAGGMMRPHPWRIASIVLRPRSGCWGTRPS